MSDIHPMIGQRYGWARNAIELMASYTTPSGSSSIRVRRSSMTTLRSESISAGARRRFRIRSASRPSTRSSRSAAMLTW